MVIPGEEALAQIANLSLRIDCRKVRSWLMNLSAALRILARIVRHVVPLCVRPMFLGMVISARRDVAAEWTYHDIRIGILEYRNAGREVDKR
jgi:hypothetical protein